MTESDSGVDTGSESNESYSMSIGSPHRSDEDKVCIYEFKTFAAYDIILDFTLITHL